MYKIVTCLIQILDFECHVYVVFSCKCRKTNETHMFSGLFLYQKNVVEMQILLPQKGLGA